MVQNSTRRGVKRESTIMGDGLMTPNESLSMSSTGTMTPKQEDIELSFSDISEDKFAGDSFFSHDGLARSSSSFRRDIRSASVSASTSHPTPLYHTAHPTMPPIPEQATGLEFVGHKVKILVDAINDLRHFGLDHVVQLPELVLVGDQSAGKSSLMSALTEVQLPRDQGMCTKCPANIKTSPAETWSCSVSLQQYFNYVDPGGKIIDTRSVTKKNPFPPWVEQKLVVKPFKTITDKADLQDVMKWAQIALLNHHDDYRQFVPGTGTRALSGSNCYDLEKSNAKAKFSPNVIAVEISGPGLPALSFYDLPGIFRVAAKPEDQYLANVIYNLAAKYIQHEHALIIWTLAMKTDPSNSNTGRLIQEQRAGNRCIGVLTNPDHIQVKHLEYENILRGQAHVTGHGYFVTKQPGDTFDVHLPSYHARAREEETHFFNYDPLWTGEWSQFRERCGTLAIQSYLSQEFAKQIAASIPSITEKIQAQTAVVDRELSSLPELPGYDVRNIVAKHLSKFSSDTQKLIDGELSNSNDFQSSWTGLCNQFRDLILHIKPMVTIAHPSDKEERPDVIEILDDNESTSSEIPSTPGARKRQNPWNDSVHCSRVNDTPVPFAIPNARANGTPQNVNGVKRENGQSEHLATPSFPFGSPASQRAQPFSDTPFARHAGWGKGFIGLDGIRKSIEQHKRTGIPGLVNPGTYNEFCMLAVNPWRYPLDTFISETMGMVRVHLQDILQQNLGSYRQTELYKSSQRFLTEFVDQLEAEQRTLLIDLYSLEAYKVFTVNEAAVNEHQAKELAALQNARKIIRSTAYVEKQMRLGQMRKLPNDLPMSERRKQIRKLAEGVKDDVLPKDPFQLEIDVAAYVRGYYITAGLRFVDSVCLSIHGKLFRNVRDKIFFHLEEKLGILGPNTEEICKALMEENFEVGQRRKELRDEKAKLEGFSRRLAELQRQAHEADLQPGSGAGAYYCATGNSATNGNLNGNWNDNLNNDMSGSFRQVTAVDENDYMDESMS